jgi:nuclear migration protein JNM1
LPDGTRELGDVSDEEDGESLERRLARLRRELEEVKEEVELRRQTSANETNEEPSHDRCFHDADELAKLIEQTTLVKNTGPRSGVGARLSSAFTAARPRKPEIPLTASEQPVSSSAAGTQGNVLSRAAAFERRLTALEYALGVPQAGIDSNALPPLLPTLNLLKQQLDMLSGATPSSVELLSQRVRSLVSDVDKLERSQAETATSNGAPTASASRASTEDNGNGDDNDTGVKVNALYGTLPTIEKLAPVIPGLLERLRSLRKVHAEATLAAESLDAVVRRQEEMSEEIELWRQGLEKVEKAVEKAERTGVVNVKTVEGWVKDLEARMRM